MVKGFIKDDILILSSDGLTNYVTKEKIAEEVKKGLDSATRELVKCANDNGGNDNITVVVIKNI